MLELESQPRNIKMYIPLSGAVGLEEKGCNRGRSITLDLTIGYNSTIMISLYLFTEMVLYFTKLDLKYLFLTRCGGGCP